MESLISLVAVLVGSLFPKNFPFCSCSCGAFVPQEHLFLQLFLWGISYPRTLGQGPVIAHIPFSHRKFIVRCIYVLVIIFYDLVLLIVFLRSVSHGSTVLVLRDRAPVCGDQEVFVLDINLSRVLLFRARSRCQNSPPQGFVRKYAPQHTSTNFSLIIINFIHRIKFGSLTAAKYK